MTQATPARFEAFEAKFGPLFTAQSIQALVEWDQRVMMPSGAGGLRASQISYLETHVHQLMTDPDYLAVLEGLAARPEGLEDWQRAAVGWQRRKALLRARVPESLVREVSETQSRCYETWKEAREKKDFAIFARDLTEIVRLRKEVARCCADPGQSLYEVLFAEFEPGMPLSKADAILSSLRDALVPLIPRMIERRKSRGGGFESPGGAGFALSQDKQRALNLRALELMGFDFAQGRLDISVHPFCSGAASDIRLTTRYNDRDWTSSFYGVVHEGGHGLYEQGMQKLARHPSLREAASLGAHESQSRFWENHVARSREFCEWFVPLARKEGLLPASVDASDLYAHVNRVAPSFIRVEADEATYHLHILLRYELELAVFNDQLSVADLPEAWNQKMKSYLGVTPPDPSQGVLQDIHWSMGAFGYFPTYTLGSLISAQLAARAEEEIGFSRKVAVGDLLPIRDWLNRGFHARGASLGVLDLVRESTGRELSHQPLIDYFTRKFLA